MRWRACGRGARWALVICAAALGTVWGLAGAQQPQSGSQPGDGASQPALGAAAGGANGAADARGGGATGGGQPSPAIGAAEDLAFRQKKIAAEMRELEERMFRLSETLKGLEPENASRLLMGLKFARDELILHHMQELEELLAALNLGEAVVGEREVLAKLQRLEELLLALDLDFQMQLERLRLLRRILQQLDTAIREEQRQERQTEELANKRRELERLVRKQATLEDLIRREQGHIEGTRPLAALQQLTAEEQQRSEALAGEQSATRQATQQLAEQDAQAGQADANLEAAQQSMEQAAEALGKSQPAEALPAEQAALAALERAKADAAAQRERLEQELRQADFPGLRNEQMQNRELTDRIADLVRTLGSSGQQALASLSSASGSMSSAEGALGQGDAAGANPPQDEALEDLMNARDSLNEELERLLDALRSEVRRRVIEGLTLMLERQVAVRESTELLSPKLAAGSRTAYNSVVSLAKSEGQIIDIADDLITLVEETEFGIALPAALNVVREAMAGVQLALSAGDASPAVIEQEKQIEADLQELLQAMKRMPGSRPSNRRGQRGQPDRQRELNRLLAELRMLRMLQVKINKETSQVDGQRPTAELPAPLARAIQKLADRQQDLRDATQRLADERGDELGGGP